MPKPICVQCEVAMIHEESGIYLVEMFSKPPKPYKIWSADLYSCPNDCCSNEVLVGFGEKPIAEHFQSDFEQKYNGILGSGKIIRSFEKLEDSPTAPRKYDEVW